jgi:PDZ domain-containing protein/aspartyl protease
VADTCKWIQDTSLADPYKHTMQCFLCVGFSRILAALTLLFSPYAVGEGFDSYLSDIPLLQRILPTTGANTGTTPAPPNASRVLSETRTASGGNAWNRVRSLVAAGTTESSGISRTWREVVDLRSPRMMIRVEAGIVQSHQTWNGVDSWRQKSSGGVHKLDSQFGRANALTDEWLEQRRYLAGSRGARMSSPEIRTDGNARFITMTAVPEGGTPVDLWFDSGSHLLARTVRRQNLETETVQYSDYRTVDGIKLPYLVTKDDGHPAEIETTRVSRYAINTATDDDFARPRCPDDSNVVGGKTVVPIEYDGFVIVNAMINGKGPFGFILDTGGHDILTPEAAKSIGLVLEGAGSSGGSGEGRVAEKYARVSRVEIGGMTMRDQTFTVLPLSYDTVEQGPRQPLGGILGLEIFERFAARLDYPAKTLTLEPLETFVHYGSGSRVPLYFNDDEPLVGASMNGHVGDFGIDTGNTGSLIVQGRWAEREGLTSTLEKGYEVVSSGMGGESRNWITRVDMDLAGVHFRGIIGSYSNDKGGAFASIVEAGNIGNDILSNFILDFDYGRGVLWFDHVEKPAPPRSGHAGLSAVKNQPAEFRVVRVTPKSPAEDAGVHVGDEITAVNGVPAGQMSGTDFRRALAKPPHTQVQLEIMRSGTAQTITVTLGDPVF